jgi:uncharacterized protein YkwD
MPQNPTFVVRKFLAIVLLVLATLPSYSFNVSDSIRTQKPVLSPDSIVSKASNRKDCKEQWERKQWRKANTARFAFYMSPRSRKVIQMMNLARLYGHDFAEIYIEPIETKSGYEKSLIKTLNKQDAKHVLRPSFGLHIAALYHSWISGITGKTGHQGLEVRLALSSPLSFSSAVGENCDYGSYKALDITLSLLIDKGVPSLGHRKNILSEDFYRAGVSSFFHTAYRTNSVTDFSGPNFRDLIYRLKPDRQFLGLELSTSQISKHPFLNLGLSYLVNHQETAIAKITAQYKYGLFQTRLQGAELEMARGFMLGLKGNFMVGINAQTYFPADEFNLYLQPKLIWFLPLNLFRAGYLYELGSFEHPALYQLSYGYNFGIHHATIPNIYKHQVTVSRYINLFGKDNTKKGRKRKR